MIEELESRRLLAITTELADGALLVVGDEAGDDILLRVRDGTLIVSNHGEDVASFAAADVASVRVEAGGGDDQVRLEPEVGPATLLGGEGSDTLLGSDRDDLLDGGPGNDHLDGKGGADVMIGGTGFDSADYRFRTEDLVLSIDGVANDGAPGDGAAGGSEGDNIRLDVERIVGGAGNDRIEGSGAANSIAGGEGDDTILGLGGDDSLDGDAGADSLDGGEGDDRLTGGPGADRLRGRGGRDVFVAADGEADDVEGGPGADTVESFDAGLDDLESIEFGTEADPEPEPEITVLRGTTVLTDGQASFDFGVTDVSAIGPTRTFTIRNDGQATLVLSGVELPAGFTIAGTTPASIPAGASDSIVVQLLTAAAGTFGGTVRILSNDADEASFEFDVSGTVRAGVPDVTVLRAGRVLAPGDRVDFGTILEGDPAPARVLSIRNDGTGPLTITSIEAPPGFAVTNPPRTLLRPGEGDTLTVRMTGTAGGDLSGPLVIRSNDPDGDEAAFTVNLAGTITPRRPEVSVFRGSIELIDGLNMVTFPTVTEGDPRPTRSFTIRNDGNATLELGAVFLPEGFSLIKAPARSVAPGEVTNFTIALDTAVVGKPRGDVRFATNDRGEDPFNFMIRGQVLKRPAPEVDVRRGSTTLASHVGVARYGSWEYGSAGRTIEFRVRNLGDAPLSLGSVRVDPGWVVGNRLVRELAPGASDTFTVRMETDQVGYRRTTVRFFTNDADEPDYRFTARGWVTAAEVGVWQGAAAIGSGPVDFGTVDAGSSGRLITLTVTNDGDAPLRPGAVQVPAGFAVTQALPAEIAPGGSAALGLRLLGSSAAGAYAGDVTFATNDPDDPLVAFAVRGEVRGVSAVRDGSALVITGTPGRDVITFSEPSAGTVTVTANGVVLGPFSGIARIELDAGGGDDVVNLGRVNLPSLIRGGPGNDVLTGGRGVDAIYGGSGNDRITGGFGADSLFGEEGDDILDAVDGTPDRMVDGGSGSDSISLDPTDAHSGT